MLTNVFRTVGLSAAAARAGLAAVDHWHDAAGLIALGANTLFLFLLTARFAKAERGSRRPADGGRRSQPRGTEKGSMDQRGPLLLAISLMLMLPLTAWWYGRHETLRQPRWVALPPVNAPAYRTALIDDRTILMLRFSKAWSARWTTATGQPLHGFSFEWGPGRVPPENLNVHQPGNCLGAIGITSVTEYPAIPLPGTDPPLHARHLRFDDHGRPLHLLYLFSEDAPAPPAVTVGAFDFSYFRRIQSVLQGRRNPGQRLIEIGLWDETSESAAKDVFTGFLREWVKRAE